MIGALLEAIKDWAVESQEQNKFGSVLFAFFLVIAVIIGAEFFYLALWNIIVAGILGFAKLNFLQFVGLHILCRVLFRCGSLNNEDNNKIILIQKGDDE